MASERFPKSDRLRRRSEFLAVQGSGQKFRTRNLVALFIERPDQTLRIGLVVSKKVGGAVVRNKVKRWLREAWRRTDRPALCGDLVLIAKTTITESGQALLQEELAGLYQKMSASLGHGTAR